MMAGLVVGARAVDRRVVLGDVEVNGPRPQRVGQRLHGFVETVRAHVPAETWAEIVRAMDAATAPAGALPAAMEGEGQ